MKQKLVYVSSDRIYRNNNMGDHSILTAGTARNSGKAAVSLMVIAMAALMSTGCGGRSLGDSGAERAPETVVEAALENTQERTPDASETSVQGSAETVSILTEEEERNLQDEAISAAKLCIEYYQEIDISDPQAVVSHSRIFSGEEREGAVKCLGKQGLVSVSDGINMENHEKMEEFYAAYISGTNALATVFEVYREGDLCAKTFIYRDGSLQSYYVSIGFGEGGIPEIRGAGAKDLEEIRMTEKGYFIYTNAATVMHGNLREYYRVKPLSDECRKLTDQYIYGLSYVNYNMLVTDWDAGNVEEILMPCMFEDIYRICTGEPFAAENSRIPAKTYEQIMTTCFPVSTEQLRKHCGYHAETDSYPYEMILGKQFPPFGEVVDHTKNKDGTITLYVDAVWIDYDSDKAFTNRIVVKPFEDGTFRYLSNTIEEKELEIPEGKDAGQESREKGYDLPIDGDERKEAEEDCIKMMELIREMYVRADKDSSLNAVLSDEALAAVQDKLKETGDPVTTTGIYANMENFESVDRFLRECAQGKSGSAVVYEIHSEGGVGRMKFLFDGTDMYVLTMSSVWNDKNEPRTAYVSCNRIKEWSYTDKGSFCYRLCVPEPPEVTEIIDGSCMLRIKPITQENRELSEKYVLELGYQGNNLLCSDWDAEHMEDLDYNGLYEYLYAMKRHEKYEPGNDSGFIPKEDFESLMMEYLPVTEEELQEYAVYDEKNRAYAWEGLDYSNHMRTYFGTSFPEITGKRENEDGTVTFTVNAVCRMFLCDDAVITHELTVRFCEDGSFRYLGNRILDDGAGEIPEYQYRVSRQ